MTSEPAATTEAATPDARAVLLDRAAETLILGLLLLAPWAYGGAPDVARYAVAAVALLAGACWAAACAIDRAGLPLAALAALAPAALAVAQSALGISVDRIATLEAAVLLVAAGTVIGFWSERGRDAAAARRLLVVVVATCVAQGAFAVWQSSATPGQVYGRTTPFVTMPFGSYVNHNHFAGLVGMGTLAAAGLAVAVARRQRAVTPLAIGWGAVALALSAMQLASRSRGGLLALAAGAVCLGLGWVIAGRSRAPQEQAPRPIALRVGAVLTGAFLLVGFGLWALPSDARARLATLLQGPADASGSYRLEIARATLAAFAAHPLAGHGLGAYADAVPAFKRSAGDVRTTHAESDALELLAEGGLVGLAAVLWPAALLLSGLRDRLLHGRDPHRKGLALAAAAGAAAFVAHAFVDFNARLPANALTFAALAGLAGAPRAEPARVGGRGAAAVLAVALSLLCGAAAWHAVGAHALDRAWAERDPARRAERLDHVLARHPYLAEAWRARALAWRAQAWRGDGWITTRLSRARRDLEAAVRLRPRWPEAWADLGWTRAAAGDASGADAAFRRAVELDPTHADVALAYADFLARSGRAAEAEALVHALPGRHMGWTPARAAAEASRLRALSLSR